MSDEILRQRRPHAVEGDGDRIRRLIAEYHKAHDAVLSLPPPPEKPTRESRQQRFEATDALDLAEGRAAREMGISKEEFRGGAETGVWRKGDGGPLRMPTPGGKPRWSPGGDVPFPRSGRIPRHGDNET